MSEITLGSYLKKIRIENKFTIKALSDMINFSTTYISSVENDKKNNPSLKFLEAYIYGVAETDKDIFTYKKKIKDITAGKYFESNSHSLMDAFMKTNAPNVMILQKNNLTFDKKFDFPVNDIAFHLKDKYNSKYFRKLKVTDDDRTYIHNLINDYFIRKVQIQKREVKHQLENDVIDKSKAIKYINDYDELIAKLNDPNDLQY
ncbi:helix-turn-helix transcriptional regulator [Staphylococcus pseudintermedius]|nr:MULTISPECIES: helix-turn-helix transcriptional regulator [Staphylococcus]EGQ2962357.1 helix-turn-helix domain-containing protein [Staphylococcus pseudintermedius]EGQ3219262.1 helix-turn-helix transcriptional regulator [Staphylococcus pseudintermedius]EGQ3355669.1 helix-turn-helix transcriptional regulator [Staphylococcus pseudintermedius]EGQ3362998.1 helix-turn-helix transcriptional regulator [Staphylococcus pseudintermedius]EGQ3432339.1 helix-turn-helix transcriptional regulator [Staphyloc